MAIPDIATFNTLGKLMVQKYERYLPTAFDESLTLLEKINKVIEYVNETGRITNELIEFVEMFSDGVKTTVEDFIAQFGDNLEQQVIDTLEDWQTSGKLDVVINEALTTRINDLEDYVDVEFGNVTAQLAQTITKGNVSVNDINKNLGVFDETYFSDEVKQQWTGETPVHATPQNLGVTTVKLADDSVTEEKASFIEKSSNLFNKNDITSNKIVGFDGTISDSSTYSISHFISVTPNSTYYLNGFLSVARYDENRNFISRADIDQSGQSITNLSNCYFMRVNFQHTVAYQRQINEGTELEYEEWYNRMSDNVEVNKLALDSVENHNIKNNNIGAEKMNFLKKSTNLFNINSITERKNIDETGEIVDSTRGYNTSSSIKVKPSTNYTFTGLVNFAEYEENGEFIKRTQNIASEETTIKTSEKTAYIHISYQMMSSVSGAGNTRVNEGSTLLPYEDYYIRFERNFKLEPLNEIIDKSVDRIMLDMNIDGLFNTSEIYGDYTDFNSTTSAEVYGMFDDLMTQYPDYITKDVLGDDSIGNSISAYYFKPVMPETDLDIKTPKVYITCGVHGYEHMSTLTTYLMLKQTCEKWNEYPLLEALRFNVNFIVIPVCNPSGWDLYQRHNANGVDLNRNFPSRWTTGVNGGEEPFDQLESQYIKQVFDDNSDIDVMIDFHNFHSGSNDPHFLWTPAPNPYEQHLGRNLTSRLTRKWLNDFDFLPDDYIAGYSSTGAGGTLAGYSRYLNIKHSYTFEICNRWVLDENGAVNDQNVCKAGVEALTNFLLINLKELIK